MGQCWTLLLLSDLFWGMDRDDPNNKEGRVRPVPRVELSRVELKTKSSSTECGQMIPSRSDT